MSNTLEHIRSLDPLRASVSMAVGIVMDRVGRLGKEDQNDLFQLVKAMPIAQTDEEQEAIIIGMLEILEQGAGTVISMPQAKKDAVGNLDKWKTHVAKMVRQLRAKANILRKTSRAKRIFRKVT